MGVRVGSCNCPLCVMVKRADTSAEVWQESKGSKKCLYIRCPRCGALQPRQAEGQVAMQQILRPLDLPAQDQAAADAGAEAAGQAATQARAVRVKVKKNRSLIAALFDDDGDDDDDNPPPRRKKKPAADAPPG